MPRPTVLGGGGFDISYTCCFSFVALSGHWVGEKGRGGGGLVQSYGENPGPYLLWLVEPIEWQES